MHKVVLTAADFHEKPEKSVTYGYLFDLVEVFICRFLRQSVINP
jgi:hypothetical protein